MRGFMKFSCAFIIVMLSLSMNVSAQKKAKDSKTTYAQEVLQPYVDSGQLSGAISVFYKDGVQETCCVGYADVAAKRPIKLDNVFMQCSQTKGVMFRFQRFSEIDCKSCFSCSEVPSKHK